MKKGMIYISNGEGSGLAARPLAVRPSSKSHKSLVKPAAILTALMVSSGM
jgi:hypothetical protein